MFNKEEHSLKRFKQPQSGGVAQLVEQRTENPCVTGSIPVLATIFVSTPVNPTGFFTLKFVDFLLKSAFLKAFSQKPYICSVFLCFS